MAGLIISNLDLKLLSGDLSDIIITDLLDANFSEDFMNPKLSKTLRSLQITEGFAENYLAILYLLFHLNRSWKISVYCLIEYLMRSLTF